MVTAIKHPEPDRIKPSFVIFDIRALWCSGLSELIGFTLTSGSRDVIGRVTIPFLIASSDSFRRLATIYVADDKRTDT